LGRNELGRELVFQQDDRSAAGVQSGAHDDPPDPGLERAAAELLAAVECTCERFLNDVVRPLLVADDRRHGSTKRGVAGRVHTLDLLT
jgi:hypothetical protein